MHVHRHWSVLVKVVVGCLGKVRFSHTNSKMSFSILLKDSLICIYGFLKNLALFKVHIKS